MVEFTISCLPGVRCVNRQGAISTGDPSLDRLFETALIQDKAQITPDIPDKERWQVLRLHALTGSTVTILTPDPAEDDAPEIY